MSHMKLPFQPKLQAHHSTGIIRVRIVTPRGAQWLSTGQTSHEKAREVCTQAFVSQLQMAACATELTADVISRLLTGRRFTCLDILDAWKQEAIIDLGATTFNSYETTIRQWFEFGECAKLPLSSIKRCHLDNFINEPRVSLGGRRGRRAAIRSFYKFASSSGYCVGNPADRTRIKRADLLFAGLEPKHILPLSDEEYRAIMSSPHTTGFWRLATALAWNCGLRIGDVSTLELASIGRESLIVHTKKTGARVEIRYDDPNFGGGELRSALDEIVRQCEPDAVFCFPEMRDIAQNPTRRAWLTYTYTKLMHKCGVWGKSFHSLRHSFALRHRKAGRTLAEIASVLGHANTQATAIYTGDTGISA